LTFSRRGAKISSQGLNPGAPLMALIENILCPVDFSPSCVAMAAYVKRSASLFGAKVSLVHVVDLASRNGFELYIRSTPEISEEHRNIGRDRLDSFLTAEFPLPQCPRILVSGDAATQIAQVARDARIDLIIMPTHASGKCCLAQRQLRYSMTPTAQY
jgi:nucleotide-binding universal stress UspA family protein